MTAEEYVDEQIRAGGGYFQPCEYDRLKAISQVELATKDLEIIREQLQERPD